MAKGEGSGWHREHFPHVLAGKGIKLGREARATSQELPWELQNGFNSLKSGEDAVTPSDARKILKFLYGTIRLPEGSVKGKSYEEKAALLILDLKAVSDSKEFFARRGDQWDNNKNILIWTGAEEGWIGGLPITDYYDMPDGHPAFKAWLKRHNLSWEYQDAGTIHIYEGDGGAK